MNELALVESYSLRQELCTDSNSSVLEKLGHLVLLKGGDFATVRQIADFYQVPTETIRTVTHRYNKELRSDGYKVISSKEFEKFHDETFEIPNRGLAIYPRRAILRIGCLLRDSSIAKLVRSYLLNAEESHVTSPYHPQTLRHLVNQLDQHALQLIENANGLKDHAEQLRTQTRMIKVIVDEIYRNRNRIDETIDNTTENRERIVALEKLVKQDSLVETDEYITQEQIKILKQRVKEKGKPCRIWAKLRLHFSITRYIFLPKERFREALDWLERYKN